MVRKRANYPDHATMGTNSYAHPLVGQMGGTAPAAADEYDIMTSSTLSVLSEAESDLDTSGGSGRSVTAGAATTSNAGQNNLCISTPPPSFNPPCSKISHERDGWYSHILTIEDLVEVDPARGQFLLSLQDLVAKKQAVLAAHELSTEVCLLQKGKKGFRGRITLLFHFYL